MQNSDREYTENDRNSLEQQIVACLKLLDIQKLLRVIGYITRIW